MLATQNSNCNAIINKNIAESIYSVTKKVMINLYAVSRV